MDTIQVNITPQPPIVVQVNTSLLPIVGASNYEIAVKNGYIGTEAEWLLTLQASTLTHS